MPLQNVYTTSTNSLYTLESQADGSLKQVQVLTNGAIDPVGNTVKYFSGLTALTTSRDGLNVYVVGTTVMPGVGGEC